MKRRFFFLQLVPFSYRLYKGGRGGGGEAGLGHERETLSSHVQESGETKGTQQQPHGEGASENRPLPLLFPQKPGIHFLVCFSKEIIKDVDIYIYKKKTTKDWPFLSTTPPDSFVPAHFEGNHFHTPLSAPRTQQHRLVYIPVEGDA